MTGIRSMTSEASSFASVSRDESVRLKPIAAGFLPRVLQPREGEGSVIPQSEGVWFLRLVDVFPLVIFIRRHEAPAFFVAGRDRSSDEAVTETDEAHLHPDDDERIWTGRLTYFIDIYPAYSSRLESMVCCIWLNMPLFSEPFIFNSLANCVAIGNHLSD
jgi:hypothetical protein